MSEVKDYNRILERQVISQALEELDFEERVVIAARYLDEYDAREIAKLLDMPYEIVTKDLKKALECLWMECLHIEEASGINLKNIDDNLIKQAFMLLFKRYRYYEKL